MYPRASQLSSFLCLGFVCIAVAASSTGCAGDDASQVINEARAAHGVSVIDTATVQFDFRGDLYTAKRDGGLYEYSRSYLEDGVPVRDIMSNDSTYRLVDGSVAEIDERERRRIESTVNSVIYFALLPYNLGDDAVRARLLTEESIRGEPYDVIEVTFDEEGGGRDWQDRYVYWINRRNRTMDFLAYNFDDDDGGGSRFREAVNPREIAGVRFQDYLNYTVDTLRIEIERYPEYLDSDVLELVSTVEIDEIEVRGRPIE
jgi:hypothetical protein